MSEVEAAVRAIQEGRLAVLPTDTVYGLACTTLDATAAAALYRLKGRAETQPTALIAASVDALRACLPELDGRLVAIARALLPGPFTLVVPNPARRFAWLAGSRPETIGVRVPNLPASTATVVEQLGAVAATSANLAGGPDPCRLEEVPPEIRVGVAVVIDGGALPGTPSTVIDLTEAQPAILRAGAGDPAEALARIAASA
jgi:L-threonylcarbamoyladenylate synthase